MIEVNYGGMEVDINLDDLVLIKDLVVLYLLVDLVTGSIIKEII